MSQKPKLSPEESLIYSQNREGAVQNPHYSRPDVDIQADAYSGTVTFKGDLNHGQVYAFDYELVRVEENGMERLISRVAMFPTTKDRSRAISAEEKRHVVAELIKYFKNVYEAQVEVVDAMR